MTLRKEDTRLKVRVKIDRAFHSFLDGKSWKKFWNCVHRKNIIFYTSIALGRIIQKKKKFKLSEFNLYAIGQSHIDAAWLWTKLSTIRRVIITFSQAVKHFEMYSFFTYSQTAPAYYDWVRRLRPQLFEKIKEYEKKGRWEIVGGMWVEPDANLPNGESLVRQRLYGQQFYLEHFGKFSKIAVLEDSFGMNAQLPQILRKSGAEAFWTTKITWNDYSEFPFANFFWRALDGSQIFVHMFKFNWMVLLDLSMYKRTGCLVKEPGLIFNSHNTREEIEALRTPYKPGTPLGIFYGFGDGGMGPLQEEIDLMVDVAKAKKLKFCNTEQFFNILRKKLGENIPIWDDELYLELHRGCYTSQANIKRLNRLCEVYLRNCEILLTIFTLYFKDFQYPYKSMDNMWKELLFNQFHDILPGSSIQDVYYEQERELEKVIEKANKYIKGVCNAILMTYLSKINKNNSSDDFAVIFNTLPWERNGIIEMDGKLIELSNIPSLCFKIINLKEIFKEKLDKDNNNSLKIKTDLKLKNKDKIIILENSKISVIIQKLTGRITSLIYKENNRELIRKGNGIEVKVYREKKTMWPAWEIYKNFTSYPVKKGMVKGIQIVEDTEFRKTVKLIYKFKNTRIDHYISLRANSDQIDFKTDIDVHDKFLLFKTRFPMDLDTNELRGEIPYGYKTRKIIPETEYEKGKWEFPAQKYVDISENNFGVTILNNSKYGWSKNEKGVYLTLLHTPPRPPTPFYSYLDLVPKEEREKYVDIGFHSAEYSLWIHKGGFHDAKPWKKGYEYNYPVIIYKKPKKKMQLIFDGIEIKDKFKNVFQKEFSIASVSEDSVILQVIKFPEKILLEKLNHEKFSIGKNSQILILRLFETSGIPQENVEISFNNTIKIIKAIETDLLERELDESDIVIKENRKLILNIGKFEIKTIKLEISI
ncbi:MAG: alpha-mannosidase [Promethearchaeia archaeon]